MRLARPTPAFCSCATIGIFASHAATAGGTVGYPPKPTTTAGRTRFRSLREWRTPFSNVAAPLSVPTGEPSEKVADGMRDRKSVGEGKSVDLGGRRIIKKK